MRNTTKKVVILELGNESASQCRQLLQKNGYQVEIKPKVEKSIRSSVSSFINKPLHNNIADEYNNVVELNLNLVSPKSLRNKD